jgi:small subunit ribosomal protein S6
MRRYETVFILHSQIAPESRKTLNDRVQKAIESKGQLLQTQDWGVKNLAYPIEKQGKGIYCHLEYQGSSEVVEQVERVLRYDEGVLRYLTVKVAKEQEIANKSDAVAVREEGGADVQI